LYLSNGPKGGPEFQPEFGGNNTENKMSLDEEICEIKLTQQNIYTDRNDNRLNSSSDTEKNHSIIADMMPVVTCV
jgi:hypothetical protein